MNSNGGGQTGFSKRELYTVVALLVMVFVMAGAMFAVPAWSQNRSEDSSKDKKTSTQQKQTQSSSTRSTNSPAAKLAGQNPSAQQALQAAVQAQASDDLDGEAADVSGQPHIESIQLDVNNCHVDTGDSITFEVIAGLDDGDFATVIDGVNADISTSNNGDTITVESIAGSDQDIEFFIENSGNFTTGTLDRDDDLVVDSSTIDCGNNNNNNDNNNNNKNRHNRQDRQDRRNAIRHLIDQYRENSDLADADNELSTLDNEISTLDNEDTLGNNGNASVSASSGNRGAEASTPGAVASANGDEDTQGPVGPQGDVVDEVPTSGPLPNTGGMPLLYWFVPLVGLLILAGLPLYRWVRRSSGG